MLNQRWLTGFALALVAGAALSISTGHSGSTRNLQHSRLAAHGAGGAEADLGAQNPHSDADSARARVYELAFQQDFATGQGAPSRVRVRGGVQITPRDGEGRDLVKLGPVAIEGEETPKATDLAVTFARIRDASGHLMAIEVPQGTRSEARRYLQAIAGALEYTLAPGGEWQASELDVGGRFASSYRRLAEGKVERYRRRFLENPEHRGLPMSMRLDGRTLFAFDANGALEALETDERAELSTSDSWRLSARLVVTLKLKGDAPARWAAHTGALERERIVVGNAAPSASAATDREQVGGRTLGDLRAEIQTLDALPESMERTRERSRLMFDHAALTRLDPAALREMGERLRDPSTPASERSLLAGSLAAAGTPEASHALGEVLKEAPLPDSRLHAAVSLNVSPAHDSETLAALEAGMKDADPDVANASSLALGSALRTLGAARGSGSSAAEALARSYTNAVSIEDRTRALSAIGNSGDTSLLPLVAHALSDPNPQIQETAAFALRFMGTAADPMLGRALSSPFPEVRLAALRAIELRPIDTLRRALESALAVERDEKLSKVIQRLLARAA
jgi:hypothetical protein